MDDDDASASSSAEFDLRREILRLASRLESSRADDFGCPRFSSRPAHVLDRTTDQDRQPSAYGYHCEFVRRVQRGRAERNRVFGKALFADPAWDMMLDLYAARLSGYRVPTSACCEASMVPSTTALRWIQQLVAKGVIVRTSDPHDGRRIFLDLSDETFLQMRDYIESEIQALYVSIQSQVA